MKNKFMLKACASNAERKIWSLLETLPDDYHVFAGVLGVQSEIDFLVTHPLKGILVIEVKGGFVSNKKINGIDNVTSTGREQTSKIKNPFAQASGQIYGLMDQIFKIGELKKHWIAHSYAVCLPDNEFFEGDFPDMYEETRLILRGHLTQIKKRIDQIFELSKSHPHKSFGGEGQFALKKFLLPEEILFSKIIENNKETYAYKSENSLIAMFHRQDDFNQKVSIDGPAGTGKTTLAIESAQRFHKMGLKTLVLCYNDPLKWKLKAGLQGLDQVEVSNFHHFAEKMAKLAVHPRQFEFASERLLKMKSNQNFWAQDAGNILLESIMMLGEHVPKYQAFIVDEAQDFKSEWYEIIKLVLAPNAKEYIFRDNNQTLYQKDFIPQDSSWFHLSLNTNHRLPADILDHAEKFSKNKEQKTNYLNLMRKRLIVKSVASTKDMVPRLEKLINELIIKEKVRPEDIVVLTPNSPEKIQNFQTFFEPKFKAFKVNLRLSPNPEKGVLFETIHRYKGLEAPIVILTNLSGLKNKDDPYLIYTGFTRAHTALIVLGTNEELEYLQLAEEVRKKVA